MARVFTYTYCVVIILTLAGGIGGSFQPARMLLLGAVPLIYLASPRQLLPEAAIRAGIATAAVMLFAGLISLSWTEDRWGGIGLLLAVGTGALAIFMIAHSDLSVAGLRFLLWAWALAVAISLPIALYEIATGNHFQFALEDRIIGGVGEFPFASIFFGNYNDYSTWLALAFPLTMATIIDTESKIYKFLLTLLNLLIVFIVVTNTSRGVLAFVIVVSVYYLFISGYFRVFSSVSAVFAIPFLLARYGTQILNMFDFVIFRFQTVSEIDESFIQRQGLIEMGLVALGDSYGFGVGVGDFEEYVNDNYPYLVPNPHNIFIEIMVNFGLVPMLGFVAFLVTLGWIAVFRKGMPQSFRLAVLFGVLSVPIIGAVPSQAIGFIYWWVWLGTLVGLASVRIDPILEKRSAAAAASRSSSND